MVQKGIGGKNKLKDVASRKKLTGKRKIMPDDGNVEKAGTMAKRRRNADMEIAQAFVSSTGKGSYDLRARRMVPSFRKVHLNENGFRWVVGERMRVFWFDLQKWFTGRIESYDDKRKHHKILYDDGDTAELDLKRERFEVEVLTRGSITLSSKCKPNTGKKEMVDAESVEEASLKMDAEPVKKYSKPKREVATKSAKKRGSQLQKSEDAIDEVEGLVSEKTVSNGGSDEQTLELKKAKKKLDTHVAKKRVSRSQKEKDIRDEMKDVKEASLKAGDVEPVKKNSNPHKKITTKVVKARGAKSHKRENTEGQKTEDVASQKTVSNGVSDARIQILQKTKKGEHQVDVVSRKNSVRKGQANVNIKSDAKSNERENTEGQKTEDAASQKTVSNGVSDARIQVLQKTKKGEHQVNAESRKNSVRKGRANIKI